jgi:ribose-phosphate pyrophosphokinase
MSEKAPFMVFSGTNSRYLAEKICASLNCPLGKMNITHFADGEFAVSYEESIRGANVFLVQSTFPNSDNLMELLLMVDAAKRASAKSVIAVIPYFGWARQDRKDKPRVSIGAKLVADLLSVAGIDRLITMDGDDESIGYLPSVDINRMNVAMLLNRLDIAGTEAFKIDKKRYSSSWEALANAREEYYKSTSKILLKDL